MITSVMMEMPGSDEWFMRQAMKESRKALVKGEVPVGAIVVKDGRVIGRGWNQVETLKDATAHAEMIALTAAQEALGDWRLEGCTLYVTKEPCPMCAGAIVHCRPDRVVFGCPDAKTGAMLSALSSRRRLIEETVLWFIPQTEPYIPQALTNGMSAERGVSSAIPVPAIFPALRVHCARWLKKKET